MERLSSYPLLDDFNWDFEAILRDNEVIIEYEVTAEGKKGWAFSWKHGVIHIGQTTEIIARKAAALFISLWLRNISASFCDKLMDGFICYLERQENKRLTFLAEIDHSEENGDYFRITKEGFCTCRHFGYGTDSMIIKALDVQPDEEIIVTFTKRKVDNS